MLVLDARSSLFFPPKCDNPALSIIIALDLCICTSAWPCAGIRIHVLKMARGEEEEEELEIICGYAQLLSSAVQRKSSRFGNSRRFKEKVKKGDERRSRSVKVNLSFGGLGRSKFGQNAHHHGWENSWA